MTTITEDYVSFETAKLLMDKGFKGETRCCVWLDGTITYNLLPHDEVINIPNKVSCPTLQMAMKWLREIYRLHIYPDYVDFIVHDKVEVWVVKIIDMKTFKEYSKEYSESSYEQACEAAIKYCLKNLIQKETVRNNEYDKDMLEAIK